MTLTRIDRPEGQREDYLFFADAEGRTFKALHELRSNDKAQPVLAISIAPIDAEGHALLLAEDVPDVTNHTHTFTEAELTAPDFDMDARVAAILRDLAGRKSAEMAARAKVSTLGDAWRSGAINLGGGSA
jgi:hypothetical protein